jgi:amino acid transporter
MTGAVAIAVVLYLAIQVVAMGTLPGLAGTVNPLALAASTFLGPAGAVILTIGAIFSTSGTTTSSMMVGSRMLYAMAQGDQLPAMFGRLHEKFRTPAGAVVICSVSSWIIAISGTFAQLAPLSALARLMFYIVTCLSIPILRRRMPAASREFTLAGGPVIPIFAFGICAWLLAGTTRSQALILVGGVAAGCVAQAAHVLTHKPAAAFSVSAD